MRVNVPSTSELKKIARNAQKRLDRVGDKWQTSSSAYQKQVDQWDTSTFKKYIDIDDTGKMKFDINKLNDLSKSERENLYLKFKDVQGVLDVEYDTQEMLKDPFTRQKIFDDLEISTEDMTDEEIIEMSELPAVIDKAEEIQKDFNKAIQTYRDEGYTADELLGSGNVLHNSEKSYGELITAGVEIWKQLQKRSEEKKKDLSNVTSEHEKAQEEWLKNNRGRLNF